MRSPWLPGGNDALRGARLQLAEGGGAVGRRSRAFHCISIPSPRSVPEPGTYPGDPAGPPVDISVISPFFNEEASLPELHRRLRSVLDGLQAESGLRSEIVAINDGSEDGSLAAVERLAREDSSLRVIDLGSNRGQHEAILVGFAGTTSRFVVTIDSDLQNPPEEIPRIVRGLEEGFDLIATRRVRREDSLGRRFASRLANASCALLARAYGVAQLHDLGCMLRGYRRGVVDEILALARRPGAPPPFIPALALRSARRTKEIDVDHARRAHGKSSYGLKDLIDLQVRLVATLRQK